jgi:hypothetical protein
MNVMPYIPKRRSALDANLAYPENVGELNYVITRRIDQWIMENGGPSYTRFNEAIDILENLIEHLANGLFDWTPSCDSEPYRAIRYMLLDYIQRGYGYHGLKGIVRCVEMELYRRPIAVYEDIKCRENGEVYTCWPTVSILQDRAVSSSDQ